MKAKDLAVKETIPQWVRIKSIFNNSSGNELGQILMNAQFLRFDPSGAQPNRVVKDKSGKQQYKFYYQILSGFELGSKLPGTLKTSVELTIGGKTRKNWTPTKEGRFPQWMAIDCEDVHL